MGRVRKHIFIQTEYTEIRSVIKKKGSLPVNFACAVAMNAAISSCRACINLVVSLILFNATHDTIYAIARVTINPVYSPPR